MGYIGTHGVAALHRHKYSGVDHSYVSKYVLQPFWTRCVHLFPLWMPPNVITLIGFMFLVTSALLGYIYSPHLDSPSPRWVHFMHGLLLFLYQMGSKCDEQIPQVHWASSSTMDVMLLVVLFFTNTLILPVINGPTEGLMLIYMAHFFTTFVGAEWWAQLFGTSFPFFSWVPILNGIPTYQAVLYLMIVFAVIPTVAFNVCAVYGVVKARKGSMLLALAMLYPLAALLGGVILWDHLSPDLIGNYPHLIIVATGLAFSFLVGRMILSHMCDEPKGLKTNMCMSLFYLPFAIANALTAKLNDGVPLVDEYLVVLGYCAYTVSLYLHFVTSVVHEITTALGTYCFRITRKEA